MVTGGPGYGPCIRGLIEWWATAPKKVLWAAQSWVISRPPKWTYVATLVTTVYNGSGFTVAPVYLSWLIPPLAGEKAGAQAFFFFFCSGAHRSWLFLSSPPLSAVCMFARDSAKRSRPSSVLHRPENIYWRVEDNKNWMWQADRRRKARSDRRNTVLL